MTVSDPDLALLARFQETGDAEAFGEIVRRYAAAVYATCHRILHDPGSAEDAAQETFYRLMTRPHRVTASLGGWLHRAATRLALDIQRSDAARRRREAAYEATQALDATSWAEVAPQLDASLAALPDDVREILVRHFLRGESQADLAAELGTSPATLSRRMKLAVEMLREQMNCRGVSVAPVLLFNLLMQNGPTATTVGLKAALGKLQLYCAAKNGVRPFSWAEAFRSLPQSIHAARWAIAAALLSLLMSTLFTTAVRQIDWRPARPSAAPVEAEKPKAVATSHRPGRQEAYGIAGEIAPMIK
ncbi:MAG TPA: sigma-70 family RNA polymerase sigma factor [Tepidisphaeraceae bacterium]|jgi:RNA polymerase sigma factor (sigma-70 family)|nr:sigma-70 family RNA polymerase sigma factor [Tepidisphaeraceae bacterium]